MTMDPSEIPLRDIHLPEAIGWWPLAPGWWLLAALTLGVIALTIAFFVHRQRHRVRRAAVGEFRQIELRYRDRGDKRELVQELSQLARRTVLALDGSREAAALTGTRWAERLSAMANANPTHADLAKILTIAPYRDEESFDADELIALFGPWLSDLRPPRRGRS